jgi:hypothetical protein
VYGAVVRSCSVGHGGADGYRCSNSFKNESGIRTGYWLQSNKITANSIEHTS